MENKSFYIFASGNGSNALKLLENWDENDRLGNCLGLVSNNDDAPVLEKVEKFEIPTICVPSKGVSREEHESLLLDLIKTEDVWIFLAGYMRVLSSNFLKNFYNEKLKIFQIVNIHPSLLPKYPGLNAYERAFQSEDAESGITIHLVDEGVDTGPILKQVKFPRSKEDTLENFIQKGLSLEHQHYPEVFSNIIAGQFSNIYHGTTGVKQ